MEVERSVRDHGSLRVGGETPEISVLVPVYNVEAYLEDCLDSLLRQSFRDIEIICVDDGSVDRCGAILDQYADQDQRVKVIHKENTGYGHSMNVAMDQAKGRYIAVLESDDFAEPDMLQKLYTAIREQNADVVKGDHYDRMDGKDVFVDWIREYPKGRCFNCSSMPKLLELADTIWSCLYDRSFLVGHDIRFHETPGASYQDISFALQVWLQADRVYFIEDALLHYRRDAPDSSMNDLSKWFCVFDEYGWVEKRLEKILTADRTLYHYFTASKYRDQLNHYHRVGVRYQYALLLRLERSFREDQRKGLIAERAFRPDVWDKLVEIAEDKERFFKRTARPIPDPRWSFCAIKNDKVYIDAFFGALRTYPKVFLYGAGLVGKRLAKAILEQGGQVDAFLVTCITDGERICMGIPILEVQEAAALADSCAVVISVTENSQYELYGTLKRYGFQHIFRTDMVIRENI